MKTRAYKMGIISVFSANVEKEVLLYVTQIDESNHDSQKNRPH